MIISVAIVEKTVFIADDDAVFFNEGVLAVTVRINKISGRLIPKAATQGVIMDGGCTVKKIREQGRGHVQRRRQMIISTRCFPRPMNVEGNADKRMRKTAAVSPEVELFFIETFAVIGTDDDDGIFEEAVSLQSRKDISDLFVGVVQ